MEQVKLERLLISEVSGVDAPANQLDGWMVTKALDGELEVVDASAASAPAEAPESSVAKIKGILLGAPREEIDVEKQEFVEAMEANNVSLATAVADAVSKSLAPAEGASTTEDTPEVTPALTAEDVAKAVAEAIEKATAPYNEILEALIGRVEASESALGIVAKSSLEGQEGASPAESVEKASPDLADAIEKAFKRPSRG